MVYTRRCAPSKVVVHHWYIVWEDKESGEIREEMFETGIVGFLHLLERLNNPSSYAFQYLGHN